MSRNNLFAITLLTALFAFGAAADAQGLAARTQPNRDGLTLMGGAWFPGNANSYAWFRGEADIHLRRFTRGDLYLQLPFMLTHRSYNLGGGNRYGFTGLALVPGVRGEWTLLNRKGDLALFLEGGAGLVFYGWGNDCAPGVACGNSGSDVFGLVRSGAGIAYTAPFGLIVNVQPFGFGWAIGNGYNDGGYWDASFTLGYRWE